MDLKRDYPRFEYRIICELNVSPLSSRPVKKVSIMLLSVYDFLQSYETDAIMWLNCFALHIDSVVSVHLAQLCFEHRLNILISSWHKSHLEPFGVSCCYEQISGSSQRT